MGGRGGEAYYREVDGIWSSKNRYIEQCCPNYPAFPIFSLNFFLKEIDKTMQVEASSVTHSSSLSFASPRATAMFYSQCVLAKKSALGQIWLAAHMDRKLSKTNIQLTNIEVSVNSIVKPDVPMALRLSSHLLVGVVRIYSRKVKYLLSDCSEACTKLKMAFRVGGGNVDLSMDQATAPINAITLSENMDLPDINHSDFIPFAFNPIGVQSSFNSNQFFSITSDAVMSHPNVFAVSTKNRHDITLAEPLLIDGVQHNDDEYFDVGKFDLLSQPTSYHGIDIEVGRDAMDASMMAFQPPQISLPLHQDDAARSNDDRGFDNFDGFDAGDYGTEPEGDERRDSRLSMSLPGDGFNSPHLDVPLSTSAVVKHSVKRKLIIDRSTELTTKQMKGMISDPSGTLRRDEASDGIVCIKRSRVVLPIDSLWSQPASNSFAPPSYLRRIFATHAMTVSPCIRLLMTQLDDIIEEEEGSQVFKKDQVDDNVEIGRDSVSNAQDVVGKYIPTDTVSAPADEFTDFQFDNSGGFDEYDENIPNLNDSIAQRDRQRLFNDVDDGLNESNLAVPSSHAHRETQDSGAAEWSRRTVRMLSYLQKEIPKAENCTLTFSSVLQGQSRRAAASSFFEILLLKSRNYIDLEQPSAFEDIQIQPGVRMQHLETTTLTA